MDEQEARELEDAKVKDRLARLAKIARTDGADAFLEFLYDDLQRAEFMIDSASGNNALREAVGERKYIKRLIRFCETYLTGKETSGHRSASG